MAWLMHTDAFGTPADFTLDRDRTAIGRNHENDLVLEDPSVSRNHATILRRDGRYVLLDQNSTLGVVVNGVPTREQVLEDGDRILLGRQALCFRDPASLATLVESPAPGEDETFRWVPDVGPLQQSLAAVLASPAGADPDLTPLLGDVQQRMERLALDLGRARHQHEILRTLLRVSALVHAAPKLEVLLSLTVDLAVKVLAADRGFVIMCDPDSGRLSVGASHKMHAEEHATGTISFGIANRVLETGQGIQSDDAASDSRFRQRQSVLDMGIRSVLCVPLRRRGTTALGVLYVDRLATEAAFSAEDLESLQGLANVAAVAVENAGLRGEGARRIRIEEELRHARELEKLKSDFLSMVSHDLRTPLTSIKSWAEILQDDWEQLGKDDRTRYLSIVNSECDRLTHLIDDLLDLQRADSGRMAIHPKPVAARPMLQQAMDAFGAQARARGIRVSMDCEADLPDVLADPERMAQVLSNLVGNALKFTQSGGSVRLLARRDAGEEGGVLQRQTVTIDLKDTRPADFVRFSVIDTGEGVPPEMQEAIFEKFRQVDSAQKDRPRGAGLGLSICKEVVEAHGGSINLESSDQGSTFYFRLPVARGKLDTIP